MHKLEKSFDVLLHYALSDKSGLPRNRLLAFIRKKFSFSWYPTSELPSPGRCHKTGIPDDEDASHGTEDMPSRSPTPNDRARVDDHGGLLKVFFSEELPFRLNNPFQSRNFLFIMTSLFILIFDKPSTPRKSILPSNPRVLASADRLHRQHSYTALH